MKKFILLYLFLTSCSLNNDSAYWNQNLYSNSYKDIKFDKDYTFMEYGELLDQYNAKSEIPNIN